MDRDQSIKLMQDLLRRVIEKKASDLFVTAGFPPAIKIDGEIRPQSERALTPEQSSTLVRAIMNDRQTKEFDSTKECNFAISPPGIGRFRVSAFVHQGFTGAVLRTINAKIPSLEELEAGDFGVDGAQYRAGEALLHERADAEPPDAGGRNREIAFLGGIEFFGLPVVHDGAHHAGALLRAQGTVGLRPDFTVDLDGRGKAGGNEQIRALLLDHASQQVLH